MFVDCPLLRNLGLSNPLEDRTSPVMGYLEILLIAGLIFINGFFVTVEFALVKVRATQIDQLAEQGNWAAKLTSKALDRLDFYLSASQIGITVASLALGRAMQDWVEPMVQSGLQALHMPSTPIAVFGISIAIVPLAALTLVTFLHMAWASRRRRAWRSGAQGRRALDGPAARHSFVRVFAGDLALEQGQQPDSLGARTGPDEHGRAGSQRGRAAADRCRKRGGRAPVAQRADDDRERAESGRKDGAAGNGSPARHRLPEPRPAARGKPAAGPPGGAYAVSALRRRPLDRDRYDPRQGHLPSGRLPERPDSTCASFAQDAVPARELAARPASCSSFSATGFTWPC